ncbi:hypothetical protein ZWY2020_035492 [Hordeum vulgare]|nr:hypothetical protein ZWY2020_035492 [Hordeum vulgare]
MYFQVHYTEENLLDYIDPNNDTLMVKLEDSPLRAECRIMLGTDKRATITTNWSEFRTQTATWFSSCTPVDAQSKSPQFLF